MSDWNKRQRRSAEVKSRAGESNHMYGYCRVIGCNKPARAGTSDGLDMRFCRSHADHCQRHGSPYKGSCAAKELNPYRRAALQWLIDHEDDTWVINTIQRVEGMYRRAGQHVEAFRLRGLSPKERAKAAWARLREHEVDPRLVVAAWLGLEMAVKDDPQPEFKKEFIQVQAAKIIYRMASGTHKQWEREVPDPAWSGQRNKKVTQAMHVYPRSRGRVLRHMGEALEAAVELLVDHHIENIHTFKNERDLIGRYDDRPWPKSWVSRRRKIA